MSTKLKFYNASRGFTLIELLVVVAIIGLLSSIVLASLNSARAKARNTKRLSDMVQLRTALSMYYNDSAGGNGSYPAGGYNSPGAGGGGWGALGTYLAPYLPTMPNDPSGSRYASPNYQFYEYWDSANFISWGWGNAACDGKTVIFAYNDVDLAGTSPHQDCPLPGIPVIIYVLN